MWSFGVPNVPCGVERLVELRLQGHSKEFLMYRVELKDSLHLSSSLRLRTVPNVPCGVESRLTARDLEKIRKFLMYRVELKAISTGFKTSISFGSS